MTTDSTAQQLASLRKRINMYQQKAAHQQAKAEEAAASKRGGHIAQANKFEQRARDLQSNLLSLLTEIRESRGTE